MPLDVEVQGDPGAIRASARWLGTASTSVSDSGDQAQRARGESETGWVGAAGDGFRRLSTRLRTAIDDVAHDLTGTRDALDLHASDLDAVNRTMNHAREIASAGGLTVTATAILEPGPAPAAPGPLPVGRAPTTAEQGAHDQATAAQAGHARQVRAYEQAQDIVHRARDLETQSQGQLNRFVNGLAEKSPLTVANLAAGFAGASGRGGPRRGSRDGRRVRRGRVRRRDRGRRRGRRRCRGGHGVEGVERGVLSMEPTPPAGQGPALAWVHGTYRGLVGAGATVAGFLVLFATLTTGGLDWTGSVGWWVAVVVIPPFVLLRGRRRLEAGEDWFRNRRDWVRTRELSEVRLEGGGNGTVGSLVLVDTAGRGVEVKPAELQRDAELHRLVMAGVFHSIRQGATMNRQARKLFG